jgi:hypothetical protein
MFGIRDEISSGIWENDETREIRWEELRWKRSETKADEPRGQAKAQTMRNRQYNGQKDKQ